MGFRSPMGEEVEYWSSHSLVFKLFMLLLNNPDLFQYVLLLFRRSAGVLSVPRSVSIE
jgi:hypothetical protein